MSEASSGFVVRVPTADDMHALGRRLGEVLRAGDLLLLDGPLGAGKTALVQGIGAGMAVTGTVSSPTFVLARVHAPTVASRPALVHVDAYRLGGDLAQLDDLDLDTDLADSVVAVEWGGGVAEVLSADRLEISIDRSAADEVRLVRLQPLGPAWSSRATTFATWA